MTAMIKAVKGMNDILPSDMALWNHVEKVLKTTANGYGYQEIRTPIVEQTILFKRAIGEATDVVEKEMFTFDDYGESITLRPEGTAGCVRAGIEYGLLHNQQQRIWYYGPMFRHEKPQKGRYRQFTQFGVETFGMEGPDIDAEIIAMTAQLWKAFGFSEDEVSLQLNCLGNAKVRENYREELVKYFSKYESQLDADSLRRLKLNPLRILDSKNPDLASLIQNAPQLTQFLDDDSRKHFDGVCALLKAMGIPYNINPKLVRGLDYYSLTVFEWTTTLLGAQGSICGGGRFNHLVEQLGGSQASPAIGFAIGVERLVSLIKESNLFTVSEPPVDAYFILLGEEAKKVGFQLSQQWRQILPAFKILMNCGDGNFKNQLKKADKSGAPIALILGEDEVKNQTVILKHLREEKPQQTVHFDKVVSCLEGLAKE